MWFQSFTYGHGHTIYYNSMCFERLAHLITLSGFELKRGSLRGFTLSGCFFSLPAEEIQIHRDCPKVLISLLL